ncbi:MAG: RNA 2',3'-cyclic phosphodiesterase [Candidatus Omnitrophica bacterium]|nr:RNA 2',3'-cyclic phosphodiesterase [Candidatus Omnitrophota bacterium]
METIRAFIALELTAEIQKQLGQIQDELRKADADVKWVKPEGIHLTLKFLGNISLKMAEEIKPVIDQITKEQRAFPLSISQVGAFPKVEYPRVIWVGIEQGKDETVKLAQSLEQRLIQLGFLPEQRRFSPHLTLGRVRSNQNRQQLKELLQTAKCPESTMPAEKVILFKSTLTPQGAIYQPLHQADLSQSAPGLKRIM